VVNLGDTFLGGSEVHGEDHLWIVINDPQAHDGLALMVNVSTLRPDAERTCILQSGEHPFILHDSHVRFMSARGPKTSDLAKLFKAGKLKPHESASQNLLAKIRAAAAASPMLATELKALL